MIPSTLVGILAFLALLGPGYVFVRRVELLRPTYRTSIFRETVSLVAASVVFNVVSLAVLAILRFTLPPTATPDIGEIVRRGAAYMRESYSLVGYYGLAAYLLAILLAFVASHPVVFDAELWKRAPIRKLLGIPTLGTSAWNELFGGDSTYTLRVGCHLTDGSWIEGWLLFWNSRPEEDSDRSLILSGPLVTKEAVDKDAYHLTGQQYAIVGAGQITRIDVAEVDNALTEQFDEHYRNIGTATH